MPRGQYKRKTAITKVNGDVAALVPETTFTSLKWWDKLNNDEKESVKAEGKELASALLNYGNSKLRVGEHLSNLRNILEPHNLFGNFLKNFHFSKRTAYRYIAGFANASARLPEPVLKAAMVRGFNIIGDTDTKPLGIYTDAVKALPVPTSVANETQANTYLDQLEAVRRKQPKTAATVTPTGVIVPQDPDTLLKEAYRFVNSRFKKLPNQSRVRVKWVHQLTGMLFADLGVSNAQSVSPIAVPEGYRAERGRPKMAGQTAAAA